MKMKHTICTAVLAMAFAGNAMATPTAFEHLVIGTQFNAAAVDAIQAGTSQTFVPMNAPAGDTTTYGINKVGTVHTVAQSGTTVSKYTVVDIDGPAGEKFRGVLVGSTTPKTGASVAFMYNMSSVRECAAYKHFLKAHGLIDDAQK